MTTVIVTQCRLCARKFEEELYSANDAFYLSRATGTHPFEDGCPWCDECRGRADDTVSRLLGGIASLDEPDAAPLLPD